MVSQNLIQIMACCHQATGHQLNPWWSRPMKPCGTRPQWVNTLRPRQNGHHFADHTFKCIFLKENVKIAIKMSLKLVPKGTINNNPSLVQIMAWHRSGEKPLSEPMMVSLLTHICVTRPQRVNECPMSGTFNSWSVCVILLNPGTLQTSKIHITFSLCP